MEAIIKLRNRIVSNKVKYGNLKFFLNQLAIQIYQRSKGKNSRIVFDDEPLLHLAEEETDYPEDQIEKLKKALSLLGETCQKIIKMSFQYEMKSQDIALSLDMSAAAVRKQKERCKKKLIDLYNQQ